MMLRQPRHLTTACTRSATRQHSLRTSGIAILLCALVHSAGCSFTAGNLEGRLRLAACEGRVEDVQVLVKTLLEINATGSSGDMPLIAAEACGQKEETAAEIVRMLIDKGADVNARGGKGMTALMYASRSGHSQVIRQVACERRQPTRQMRGAS